MSITENRLSITLPSDLEIRMTRSFNAPIGLVYEAITDAEHVKNWWGPDCVSLVACEMDFRVGGKYRMVARDEQGNEHPFCGEYLEIEAPNRIVQTQIYDLEPFNQFPATVTVTLSETDGTTTLVSNIRHLVKEARDGHLASGMEEGAAASYDKLARLLEKMKAMGEATK